ncbi:hypothetical protein GCM10010389_61790 [Streptomyces echinoruber]|uniref:Uncharacterized protein n=1 Tax=Streptomyces echinoruber TaxID=68898 RepID=A0A918RXN9_9ACTN|nr:hypothetical protein GCM10010389_61790 [Streptomyces echinoruber]
MGAPGIRHDEPAVGDGAPSIPVPADPPPEALLEPKAALCGAAMAGFPLMAAPGVRPVAWCGISGPYERPRIWQRWPACRRHHDPASCGNTKRL